MSNDNYRHNPYAGVVVATTIADLEMSWKAPPPPYMPMMISPHPTASASPLRRTNSNSHSQSMNSGTIPCSNQYAYLPPPIPSGVPHGTVHCSLSDTVQFLTPAEYLSELLPPESSIPATPSEVSKTLFLGQIRFETTTSDIRQIIHFTTGVVAARVESRNVGCFVVYLRDEDEMELIRSLHKRLLFDHTGIWFAETAEMVETLTQYVNHELPFMFKTRLPKDSMVVEEQRPRHSLPAVNHILIPALAPISGLYTASGSPYYPNGSGTSTHNSPSDEMSVVATPTAHSNADTPPLSPMKLKQRISPPPPYIFLKM